MREVEWGRNQPCVKDIIENVKRCKEWQQWSGWARRCSLSEGRLPCFSLHPIFSLWHMHAHRAHKRALKQVRSLHFIMSICFPPRCNLTSPWLVSRQSAWACSYARASLCSDACTRACERNSKRQRDTGSALDPDARFTSYPHFYPFHLLHMLASDTARLSFASEEDEDEVHHTRSATERRAFNSEFRNVSSSGWAACQM